MRNQEPGVTIKNFFIARKDAQFWRVNAEYYISNEIGALCR